MKQINSNNEEEIQTAVTGQIEKISSITDKNDIKENRANSVEKILFMYATAVSDVAYFGQAVEMQGAAKDCKVWQHDKPRRRQYLAELSNRGV